MPRAPQITRTMQTTVVTVLCLDTEKQEPVQETVTLPRTYKDERKLLKVIQRIMDTDTLKAVKILSTDVKSTLYGMDEQKFIENAEILEARNKPVNKED